MLKLGPTICSADACEHCTPATGCRGIVYREWYAERDLRADAHRLIEEGRKYGFAVTVTIEPMPQGVEGRALTDEERADCGLLSELDDSHGAVGQEGALDVPLPADVTVGGATFRKGVQLSTFVRAARRWHETAFPDAYLLTAAEKAANLARLQACSKPGEAQIATSVAPDPNDDYARELMADGDGVVEVPRG